MQSLAEQLKPLRAKVEAARLSQQLATLSVQQLRTMMTDESPHLVPYRTRIYAEIQNRRKKKR